MMVDFQSLLPHSKKDVKMDKKDRLTTINEIAEIKNCNRFSFNSEIVNHFSYSSCRVLYFEERKRKDLYIWLSLTPNGPSAKFHVNKFIDGASLFFLTFSNSGHQLAHYG